jgi:hypothetical protein
MPKTKTLQRSFAGGEMSPEMFGRIDDSKFQTGAALMRNFIAQPQGPAENRPGLKLVREVKDSDKKTRLIPFTYSTTQTMVLEFGDRYIRFHTQGQTVFFSTPAAYDPAVAYELADKVEDGGKFFYCVQAGTGNATTDAAYWYELPQNQVYEIPTLFLEDELFDIHYVQSADVLTIVHPNHPPIELRRYGATTWILQEINFGSPLASPTGVNATRYIPSSANVNTDTYEDHTYVVTAVGDDEISESDPSSPDTITNNIYVTGASNTITWNAVTNAKRYYVYKKQGGIFGYIGSTTDLELVDNNIGPDFSVTPPNYDNDFVGTGNYPGAVSYFEQRRCFAGTINEPQKIWMTKSGTESQMSYGLPIRDDDRIEFRVAAREANTIRHIAPLNELILLTGSAEWRVTSVNTDAITPSSISVRPQSYVGASNVQPVIVNNTMIYSAARGGHLRELGYNWQANGFISSDLSLRATHLFDGFETVDLAYMKAPTPIVWTISSNGDMVAMTYVPEQQVGAIHAHNTDGEFESCCVVAEGIEDRLYVIVKREINGQTVRFIERMQSRKIYEPEDAFFVDCGSTYDGRNTGADTATVSGGTLWDASEALTITMTKNTFTVPGSSDIGDAIRLTDSDGQFYRLTIEGVTSATVATVRTDKALPAELQATSTDNYSVARNVISGLNHLEGKTVSILADGAVHPQRVVSSGQITLDRAHSVVHVGLQYIADLKTLPMQLQVEAFGQGLYKNVNHAWLRVNQSSGIFIGPDENNLVEAKQRTNEPYGVPPRLKTEEIKLMLSPKWADGGQVFVRQQDPLPLSLIALTYEVALGG